MIAGTRRSRRCVLSLLACLPLVCVSLLTCPFLKEARAERVAGVNAHLHHKLIGRWFGVPNSWAAHCWPLLLRDGDDGVDSTGGTLIAGFVPRASDSLRLRGGGRGKIINSRPEDFPLPPSLRRRKVSRESEPPSSDLDIPEDDDDTSIGTSSSSSDDKNVRKERNDSQGEDALNQKVDNRVEKHGEDESESFQEHKDTTSQGSRTNVMTSDVEEQHDSVSGDLCVREEEEKEELRDGTSTYEKHAQIIGQAAKQDTSRDTRSADASKSDLLKAAAEKFANTFAKSDGRRAGVTVQGDVVNTFDGALVGRGLSISNDGTRLTKWEVTMVPGADLGYVKQGAWQDEEESLAALQAVPTFCVFGPEHSGGVQVYHFLVETCHSGNMFIGCVEPPMDWARPNFAYWIKERGWMVTDGGSVFRTGHDIGGKGFCDERDQPGAELKELARECGAEMLTAQLKKELYPMYPEVTQPGIWCFQGGSVITLTLDRDDCTATFEIDDRPPFTLRNISTNARPFVNMLFTNDTVSLLTPGAAEFARQKWRVKQRTPADQDYWLWDYERWTMKDGGYYYKGSEVLRDETKKNVWFPHIDNKDGQRPVPGLSLMEYNFRREAMRRERESKRRRERERLARRAEEKGEKPATDWRQRKDLQNKKPQRDDVDESERFLEEGAQPDQDSSDFGSDPVARLRGMHAPVDSDPPLPSSS